MTIKGNLGFEFEGFILQSNFNKLKSFCKRYKIDLGSDGSVYANSNYTTENNQTIDNENNYTCFELRGLGLVFNIEDTTKIYKLFEKLLKLGFKCNSSCGLHIHISFKENANYYKLLNYEFANQFQEKIKKIFITDYQKLRLNQHYCESYKDENDFKINTNTQILSRCKGGNRFKAINYNSFNIHKTIEFRIFPATQDLNNFKTYVKFLLKNIEDYLSNSKKIEFVISENIVLKQSKTIIIKMSKTTDNTINPTPAGRERLPTDNTTQDLYLNRIDLN